MAKTYLLIPLDTGLVSQIKEVLPNTRFESAEAAIADVVVDGITGSSSAWTRLVTWEPGEDSEESSPADSCSIGNLPREVAAKLNPLIGSCFQSDTLNNCSGLAQLLGEIASAPREVETKERYEYLIGWTIEYALQYESSVNSAMGKL